MPFFLPIDWMETLCYSQLSSLSSKADYVHPKTSELERGTRYDATR